MRIVRQDFSGGLIGQELRWRSDIAQYPKSLVQCSNMLPTPYGGIRRRPPLVSIGTIFAVDVDEVVYYPKDARAFDFIYSSTYRYIAVFVVLESDGQSDITRLVIQNASGTEKSVLEVPYTQQQIAELDIHQNNDKMWIVHNDQPQAVLTRVSDTSWTYDVFDTRYGPYMDENEDRGKVFTVSGNPYSTSALYRDGEVVQLGNDSPVSITAAEYAFWYSNHEEGKTYLLRLAVGGSHGFVEGDSVYVDNLAGADFSFDGAYSVIRTGTTYIEINTGRAYRQYRDGHEYIREWINNYALPTSFASSTVSAGSGSGFYTAIHAPDVIDVVALGEAVGTGKLVIEVNEVGVIVATDTIGLFDTNLHDGAHVVDSIVGASAPYLIVTTTDFAGADIPTNATVEFPINVNQDPTSATTYWRQTYTGMTVDINSNYDVFTSLYVGSNIRIKENFDFVESGTFAYDGGSDQESSYIPVYGSITFTTKGVWQGTVEISISEDDAQSWERIDIIDSSSGTNPENTRVYSFDKPGILIKAVNDGWSALTGDILLYSFSQDLTGGASFRVIEYTSARSVKASVYGAIRSAFSTSKFALGSFGVANGYPGSVTIYENRLWFGGTGGVGGIGGEPFKLWASVVGEYDNFNAGFNDTDAVIFQAQADSSTRISWLEPKENLFFGTDFGEYSVRNLDSSRTLSATNPPVVERHTSSGSARISSRMLDNSIAFISSDAKRMSILRYDGIEQDGYRSYDMTWANPDISGTGIKGICLQRTPFPVLWMWTEDGNAISFTFDREHNVIGWAEHSTTDGTIKSLCVIPDANGIDEIYAVVDRPNITTGFSGPGLIDDEDSINDVYINANGLLVVGAGTTADNGIWLEYDEVESKPRFSKLGDSSPTEFVSWDDGVDEENPTAIVNWHLNDLDNFETSFNSYVSLPYISNTLFSSYIISSDGLTMYAATRLDGQPTRLIRYKMTSPWDYSTLEMQSDYLEIPSFVEDGTFNHPSITLANNETQIWMTRFVSNYVKISIVDLASGGSLDGATASVLDYQLSYTNKLSCHIWLSQDGYEMQLAINNAIVSYSMTSAFDHLTLSADYSVLDLTPGITGFYLYGATYNNDGRQFIVNDTEEITLYNLSTAYDLRTKTLVDTINMRSFDNDWYLFRDIRFNGDGTQMTFFCDEPLIPGASMQVFDTDASPANWSIADRYMVYNSAAFPPETGWLVGEGDSPAPTIVYKIVSYSEDYAYVVIELSAGTYAVARVIDGVSFWESENLLGQYDPITENGAAGYVYNVELDYHIEKLDYLQSSHTDNYGGPLEITMTSICEPTPLTRGPTFLEGNMKFRSNKGFLYIVRSNGGEVSVDGGDSWETLDYSRLTADSNGLYTGKLEFNSNSGYVDYSTLQIRTSGVYPLNITALGLEVDKNERR